MWYDKTRIPTWRNDGVGQPTPFVNHRPDGLGLPYFYNYIEMSQKTALQFVTLNNHSSRATSTNPKTPKLSKINIFELRTGDVKLS